MTKWIVASDIDGTLTGDSASLERLAIRLRRMRTTGGLYLILATGRRLEQVVEGISAERLPEPDAVLCQVGTEIYLSPLTKMSQPVDGWRNHLLKRYSRAEACSFLDGIEGLVMQPDIYNTELKTSCYLDACPDPEASIAEIRRRVAPHADRYQVVWSSDRDLDILPADAGKGKAVRFLVEHNGFDPERVVVAGDTGNDFAMFAEFANGIAVANSKRELFESVGALDATRVYLAEQPFAAGVEEGLEFFGVLDESANQHEH